ncbi:hypothetical protein L208DRAFT_726606 [Tricholoma matsutake]|nr:hypothetical protein L208DRAFT_726606 [Tricholoma matsutake 945]
MPEVIDLTQLTESSEEDNDDDELSSRSSSSESSYEEILLDEVTRAQLHTAIDTVTEKRLREILRVLADTIPAVEMALVKELVTVERETRDVIPRWETCVCCDEEFEVNTQREDGECIFHPGELVVHEASFVDWDEDNHGPMDSRSNRRDCPENFRWTCCDNDGTRDGCVHGVHRVAGSRKRRRV